MGRALHDIFNLCTVRRNNRLCQLWNISYTSGDDSSACLRQCNAVVINMFMSQTCCVLSLRLDNDEHNKSGLLTQELLFFVM